MGSSGRRDDKEALMQSLLGRKKLHLVLDLDHTLVHCVPVSKLTVQDSANVEMMMIKNPAAGDTHLLDGGALVLKLRPGVRSFLEKASTMFDLSIYILHHGHPPLRQSGRRQTCPSRVIREGDIEGGLHGGEAEGAGRGPVAPEGRAGGG
ncbi:unnamed protein product [Cuscuta campestris]|uniref:protein-serine/threonine phosphatase n=1 Tax=Cuscuta campestris TaxID=132261 RepID=A0A484LRJ8_9ASTE|nr:unnamed protein product [Cuscuta campestris]